MSVLQSPRPQCRCICCLRHFENLLCLKTWVKDVKRRCRIQICNPTYSKNLSSFLILFSCLKYTGFDCLFSTLKFSICLKFSFISLAGWPSSYLEAALQCWAPFQMPEWFFCRRTIKTWWYKCWTIAPIIMVQSQWDGTVLTPCPEILQVIKFPLLVQKCLPAVDIPQTFNYTSKLSFIPLSKFWVIFSGSASTK